MYVRKYQGWKWYAAKPFFDIEYFNWCSNTKREQFLNEIESIPLRSLDWVYSFLRFILLEKVADPQKH